MLKLSLAATTLVALIGLGYPSSSFGLELTTPDESDAQENAEARKERKVYELLELTGPADLGIQVMDSMMNQFKSLPGLPEGYIETFMELADPDEMIELVVPIYMERLDESTIDGATKYFSSPDGRAMQAAQPPLIMEDSIRAGQEWGAELSKRVMENL